jgi:hypothetical protein
MRAPVAFNTASVTTPTGFVKLIRYAPGARCFTSRAYSTIGGIVAIAIAKPPAPTVSCATRPCSSAIRS